MLLSTQNVFNLLTSVYIIFSSCWLFSRESHYQSILLKSKKIEAELLIVKTELLKFKQEEATVLLESENFYMGCIIAILLLGSLSFMLYFQSNNADYLLKLPENQQIQISNSNEFENLTQLFNQVSNESSEKFTDLSVTVNKLENTINNFFLLLTEKTGKDKQILPILELINQSEIQSLMLDVSNNLTLLGSTIN
jgi:hypothetical protein